MFLVLLIDMYDLYLCLHSKQKIIRHLVKFSKEFSGGTFSNYKRQTRSIFNYICKSRKANMAWVLKIPYSKNLMSIG